MSRKAIYFLILTFGFSWIILPIYFALGYQFSSPYTLAVLLIYMFVPMTMAIVVQKLIFRQPLREPLGIRFKVNRWFFVGWLLPPLVAMAAMGVNLLIPGVTFSSSMEGMYQRFAASLTPEQVQQMRDAAAALPIHPFWLALIQGLIAGITINAFAAFGEELGWRGMLQRELSHLGFWKSSALVGVIWGVWHAPIILQGYNYPEHPQIGVLLMVVFTTLLAPLIAYVRIRARSVLAAAVMHGTVNGTAGLGYILIFGGNDLTNGVLGLSGFVALAVANLSLFLYDRRFRKEPLAIV